MADTIAAIATPRGYGGVAVVRMSGPQAVGLIEQLTQARFSPRRASLARARDAQGLVIDEGLVITFPAPDSYTGEQAAEFQGHGGPVVSAALLARMIELGARQALPGEFTQRAFVNDKLDLAQAEAVADLIHAGSIQAAQAAQRSLAGGLSDQVADLSGRLLQTSAHLEAAMDFADEDIAPAQQAQVAHQLAQLADDLQHLLGRARAGARLSQGMNLVLTGPPNVGKSSLLNALARRDAAIVTDIPGTTRDVLREHLVIAGMPVEVLDTAGLRESDDPIEREGVSRAQAAAARADLVLELREAGAGESAASSPHETPRGEDPRRLVIYNKVDLQDQGPRRDNDLIWLSATTGAGLDLLESAIAEHGGISDDSSAGALGARQRHLDALQACSRAVEEARSLLEGEDLGLVGQILTEARAQLHQITGATLNESDNEQLLGAIFSRFCVGK